MKVAHEAGRLGERGQAQLRQALSLAARYSINDQQIYFAYLRALVTEAPDDFQSLEPLAVSALAKLQAHTEVNKHLNCRC